MKIKWNTIKQILKISATIITTIFGTYAIQACSPNWF